jgi:hypothetical protein
MRILLIELFSWLALKVQGNGYYYRGELLTPEQVKAYDNFGWPRA